MHPTQSSLALFAGKDLNLFARLRIARHLHGCPRCSRQVEQFRGIREWTLEQEGEAPPGVNWDGLAAEMRANIRLGLAAGQCVAEPAPHRVPVRWLNPAMALPVLLVVVAGWIAQSLHPPVRPFQAASRPALRDGVLLEATSDAIGLEHDGRGFALLHPRAGNIVYTVRAPAAVRARYVDADTGQVTISHVYAE